MPLKTKGNVLYISYDGMTDPLGQSQVIPYLKGLSEKGYSIHLMSYEKPDRYGKFKQDIKDDLSSYNIKWIPFKYHKRLSLLATIYDLLIGFAFLLFYIPKHKIKLIHCRSYVASILGMFFKKIYSTKFIFDMRGFWVDERIEGGLISKGVLYNNLKKLEKSLMRNADAIISLTLNAIDEMKTWSYVDTNIASRIHHITTCCNIEMFEDVYKSKEEQTSLTPPINFLYIGSIGPWHSYDQITEFVEAAYHHVPNSKFTMIINWGIELFEGFIKKKNFDLTRFDVKSVPHKDIPSAITNADIGFFFVPPVYAKKASSPTKMGEMLSAGIPVISGHSIGDVDMLINDNNIGAIIYDFNSDEYIQKIDLVIDSLVKDTTSVRKKCFNVAEDYFSLEKGINKYNDLYENLLKLE